MVIFKLEHTTGADIEEHSAPLLKVKDSNDTESSISSIYSLNYSDAITTNPRLFYIDMMVGALVSAGAASSIYCIIKFSAIIVYIAGGVCLMQCAAVFCIRRKIITLPGEKKLVFCDKYLLIIAYFLLSTIVTLLDLPGAVSSLRKQSKLLNDSIECAKKDISALKIVSNR